MTYHIIDAFDFVNLKLLPGCSCGLGRSSDQDRCSEEAHPGVFFFGKKQKTPSFHVSSCFPSCLSKSSIFFERKIERYEDTESLPCLASQRSRFLTPQLSHGTLHPKLVGSWALLGGLQRPPFAVAATGWKSCSPVIPLDAYIYILMYTLY